jgi:ABC-2 type transport system permease protein
VSGNRINVIRLVARSEFDKAKGNPVTILIACLIFIEVILNSAGYSSGLDTLQNRVTYDVFFRDGLEGIVYSISMLCTIMAIAIGVLAMAWDRPSTGLLLTKPLYRTDVMAGKFFGICTFLLLFIGIVVMGTSLLVMSFYRPPSSWAEFGLRVPTYILVIFLNCAYNLAIAMLFGAMFGSVLEAVGITVTYFFIEWYGNLTSVLGDFKVLNPMILEFSILGNPGEGGINLLVTTVPFFDWLNSAAPYIIFNVAGITILFIAGLYMFARSDKY